MFKGIKKISCMALVSLISGQLFASGVSIRELDDMADKVVQFFKSPFIVSVIVIALITLGISLVMNWDKQQLKNKLVGWFVAVFLIFGGPAIAAQFAPSSGLTF